MSNVYVLANNISLLIHLLVIQPTLNLLIYKQLKFKVMSLYIACKLEDIKGKGIVLMYVYIYISLLYIYCYFFVRDYYVVEFPDEKDKGSVPLCIIPSSWTDVELNGEKFCWWPNFKSEEQKRKAVIQKLQFENRNCIKCKINIKYKTNLYEKAVKKLKKLEDGTSSEAYSDLDVEKTTKRKPKPSSILKQYVFEDSQNIDSDDEIPNIRRPQHRNRNESSSSSRSSRLSSSYHPPPQSFREEQEPQLDMTLTNTPPSSQLDARLDEILNYCKRTNKIALQLATKTELLAKDLQFVMQTMQR
ncbi:uncharacterized protein LOC116159434 isoform X1 [Photinus pyralis]|uniref:uncharacterized protein LOC116159434 isoform X1 n=1 Tax=Photinus pyralis TaxID=7054 RepID=UPI001267671C|nr:uncharacterized protein LOC116159434 isoform X1 [Photinus pyralis]